MQRRDSWVNANGVEYLYWLWPLTSTGQMEIGVNTGGEWVVSYRDLTPDERDEMNENVPPIVVSGMPDLNTGMFGAALADNPNQVAIRVGGLYAQAFAISEIYIGEVTTVPVYVPFRTFADRIETGWLNSNARFRVGIRESLPNLRPGKLLAQSPLLTSPATSSLHYWQVTGDIMLNPGVYFIDMVVWSATHTTPQVVQSSTAGAPQIWRMATPNSIIWHDFPPVYTDPGFQSRYVAGNYYQSLENSTVPLPEFLPAASGNLTHAFMPYRGLLVTGVV